MRYFATWIMYSLCSDRGVKYMIKYDLDRVLSDKIWIGNRAKTERRNKSEVYCPDCIYLLSDTNSTPREVVRTGAGNLTTVMSTLTLQTFLI